MNEKENNEKSSNQEPANDKKVDATYDNTMEEFLDDVRTSLSKQVVDTMNHPEKETGKQDKGGTNPKGERRGKIWKYVMLPLLLLTILAIVLFNTSFGKELILKVIGNYSYGKLNYVAPETTDNTTKENPKPSEAANNTNATKGQSKTISNVLLIGVETFDGAQNTDTMIIASIDSKNNVIKLTSLMRDLYVEIPGHNNGKLNSAYSRGGINELYDTIETNFGVKMDGYALVDFNDFQEVIDYVGGIDITLTQKEANYLNSTNYISDPANRTMVAGTQHMNGNQVLGYCRVRKVPTETEHDDFGRTQRQRIVLEQIFEKMRTKNVIQLGLLMNNILNNIDIQTDITRTAYNNYLQQAAHLKEHPIQTLRIPTDDNYTNESYSGTYVKDVLVPKDWNKARSDIYNFIYGDAD